MTLVNTTGKQDQTESNTEAVSMHHGGRRPFSFFFMLYTQNSQAKVSQPTRPCLYDVRPRCVRKAVVLHNTVR